MASTLHKGDKVTWQTSQGKTSGTITEKITGTAKVKTHKATAAPDAPQYKVQSAKSGKAAIHKPAALHKIK